MVERGAVIRTMIPTYSVPHPIVMVSQGWPCWLSTALSLSLPIERVYAHSMFESMFSTPSNNKLTPDWYGLGDLTSLSDVNHAFILGSGSYDFLEQLPRDIPKSCRGFMFAVDVDVSRYARERDFDRQLGKWRRQLSDAGLDSHILAHTAFGGVTNAKFLMASRGFSGDCFVACDGLPRTLGHIINAASSGFHAEIKPPPSHGIVARAPIVIDDLLQRDGLFNVFTPGRRIACPSVFSNTKWVRRELTPKEKLRMWDVPLIMDKRVLEGGALSLLENRLPPLLVSSIFRSEWSDISAGGGETSTPKAATATTSTRAVERSSDQNSDDSESNSRGRTTTASSSKSKLGPTLRPSLGSSLVNIAQPAAEERDLVSNHPTNHEDDFSGQLLMIKHLHDAAKAVKADDAEVPVHLWNSFVTRGTEVNDSIEEALEVIRNCALRWYRRKLTRDCVGHLIRVHGANWHTRSNEAKRSVERDVSGTREIVGRAAINGWFDYPAGSRLHFFRFPTKYRMLARDGVPIFYQTKGPQSLKAQPPIKPAEKRVLRDKILKMWRKRYVDVPPCKLSSAIMYFAVPKGEEDWQIVYHAGANGLNDSVWVPSFWLPTINSLLRIVDESSFMEDRDIGEMFLNFELHFATRRFTGVDVEPLEFTEEECPHRWLWWTKNLMGFRSSPYNSVKMYLIAEEVIKGDRLDADNPFWWHHIELNLPGTACYTPTRAWISKRRNDGSLASDMVVFVDDKRIAGSGPARVKDAGHASSTRESYLGIQDALRKWRSAGGTKTPGAWAGSVVHVDEERGVMVLTSQEKWDRMKDICRYWLRIVESGETMLEYKKLQSDRGFMVYATRPYPAMKPYLKGFHLSLEMWRGGRDAEGWKLPTKTCSTNELMDWTVNEEDEEALLAGLGSCREPPSGVTCAVPRFRQDLEAILELAESPQPLRRVVRHRKLLTAYYGFGDASSDGFGATVEREDGLQGRYGLWSASNADQSSNFRELLNLVETIEEEAREARLSDTELWLFTDNSVAESCLTKGSSSSKLLHDLIVRLRKVEMECGVSLHVVHVAGTRMIAQGTDGLSRGLLLEGVLAGRDMLSFVDIAKTAVERQPTIMSYVRSWAGEHVVELTPQDWFEKGHGIVGGGPNKDGLFIPRHAPNGRIYAWLPPPIIADVALEEALKSTHKQTDAFHIFLIPRLCTTCWIRLFYKLCDFVFCLPPNCSHLPLDMHEPLYIGIALPLCRHRPWSLRGTPVLVEMDRELRKVLSEGQGDGRDILCELLRTPGRLSTVPEHVARGMLRMPGDR